MRYRPFFGLALAGALFGAATIGACGGDDSSDGATTGDDGGNDGTGPTPDTGPPPPQRSEFGLDSRPPNPTCKAVPRPKTDAPVKFQQVYGNLALDNPMVLDHIPGDSTKWFAALRGGTIVTFPSSNPTTTTTVADVATLSGFGIGGLGGEGGLLGMAFHPNFAANNRLYISWTSDDTGSCAAPPAGSNFGNCAFRSRIGYLTWDPGQSKFVKYDNILVFDQTSATNHKGGCVRFGTDGFLYASFGDGGQGDDPFDNGTGVHNGQSKDRFFSKVLRLDVDNPAGGKQYGIPAGNPFAGGGGLPEIFAYGFRNPFRFSLDRATNDLWVGDVGQNEYEEIDKVSAGGNYGWSCREGFQHPPALGYETDTAHCPNGVAGLIDPVVELTHLDQHPNSRSITGGVVYRGKAIPNLVGTYVFGDYIRQELYTIAIDAGTGKASFVQIAGAPSATWVEFAEDVDGEVYVVALENQIWKIIPDPGGETGPDTFPDKLSKTGCVDPANVLNPASGLVPFGVNVPLWSDGADKRRWMALPDGTTITIGADGDFDFPTGTVMMKEFSLGGKKIETRLLMRHDDGNWGGYSYEWLDDQSDALLLPSSKAKPVGSQTWYYPSRSDCMRCHTQAADRTLGPELGQLNGDFVYTSTNRISNQLHTLEHIGMFSAPLGKPLDQIVAYPAVDSTAPADQRGRAYVHANCSHCHRPQGGGGGDIDFRYGTAFTDMKICNVTPQRGDLGITGAKLLIPGDPTKSMISIRPHAPVGSNRMPPLASSIVDTKGVTAIDDWIKGVTSCP
jgi:uncharacterized repeat protein (TIGR03806 family)